MNSKRTIGRTLRAAGVAGLTLLLLGLGRGASAQSAPNDSSVFDQLGHLGFHLQRAVGSPDGDTPATFSFLHSAGQGTVYNCDFALIYTPPDRHPLASLHRKFQPSIEGKIASDDSSSEDAWRFRLSLAQDQETVNQDTIDPISTFTLASVVEENDRDFKTEKLLGEFLFTPTIPAAYIGEPPHGKRSAFVWRPFFGIDYGATLRRGDSQEVSPTVFRLLLRTRAYLFLNGLQHALGTRRRTGRLADGCRARAGDR